MSVRRRLLLDLLCRPELALALDDRAWDIVLRQARASGTLGRLACLLEAHAPNADLPPAVVRAAASARTVVAKIGRDLRLELEVLRELLADLDCPVILLKGTAYVAAGLPAAAGRIFGDIDLLVPRDRLDAVERQLLDGGWSYGPLAPYDALYYRRWTHELPPLEHTVRGTLVDVHHAIVQERRHAPGERALMMRDAVPVDERFATLKPEDMVLHAAVHLFNDGEFDRGLRDLLDIKLLIDGFARTDGAFLERLVERATLMRFEGQTATALSFAEELLGLEVSAPTARGFVSRHRAPPHLRAIMWRGLLPHHASAADGLTALACGLLYVRGHWLRMPPMSLAMHLARKALLRDEGMTAAAP